MSSKIRFLSFESSCDDMSVAALEAADGDAWPRILSFSVQSQNEIHEKFGGIVPELASRAHLENLLPCMKKVLVESELALEDFDFFCATERPGLIGSLLIGHSSAKTLSLIFDKPFVGVSHLEGHLSSVFLESTPELPLLLLMVSGGHTSLYRMETLDDFVLLGETLDDAVGEAFDKGAKILGLGFPGGPAIERIAKQWSSRGDFNEAENILPSEIFCRLGSVRTPDLHFSFSGLKSELVRMVQKQTQNLSHDLSALQISQIAFHYQESLLNHLQEKLEMALSKESYQALAIVGGVASNQALRKRLSTIQSYYRLKNCYFPSPAFCTDNAAMIGARAYRLYRAGKISDLRSDVSATLRPMRIKKRSAS